MCSGFIVNGCVGTPKKEVDDHLKNHLRFFACDLFICFFLFGIEALAVFPEKGAEQIFDDGDVPLFFYLGRCLDGYLMQGINSDQC